MLRVGVVYKTSGPGLSMDYRIIREVLSAQCIVQEELVSSADWVHVLTPAALWRFRYLIYTILSHFYRFFNRFKNKNCDVAIYLESYRPWYAGLARYNVLIPNQEWFSKDLIGGLHSFDAVWCKTRAAEAIFKKLHHRVIYIGFSAIVNDPAGAREISIEAAPNSGQNLIKNQLRHKVKSQIKGSGTGDLFILHRAGNSLLRGTGVLLKTWAAHPEWPMLSVMVSRRLKSSVCEKAFVNGENGIPNNITFLQGCWNDEEFATLMRSADVHIHPTETEGYGLTLSEALGYGCLVMATDAEPMNELVSSERGILFACTYKGKYNLGNLYRVSPESIVRAVEVMQAITSVRQDQLRKNARLWFLGNRREFEERLIQQVEEISLNLAKNRGVASDEQ